MSVGTGRHSRIEMSRLVSGPTSALILAVLAAGSGSSLEASSAGEPLRDLALLVTPVTGPARGFDGELSLASSGDGGEPLRIPLAEDGKARAALPLGSTWRVCPHLEGWWGRCELVTLEAGEGPQAAATLKVWPAGRLVGRFKAADPTERPERVAVTVWTRGDPGGREEIPESTLLCDLAEPDGFGCKVPAAKLDLTVRAEGFVPRDYRAVEVPASGERSLGTVQLERGASLVGRVEVDGGEIAPGACVAALSPFVPPGPGRREADRGARSVASAKVRADGSFRVGGVPPGTYLLEVEQPGFAPVRAFPIQLSRDSETRLREGVVLHRPLAVEIEIAPPLDWLNRPWTVKLTRQSDYSSGFDRVPPITRQAARDGKLVVPNQAPGTFAVQVLDSQANSMYGSLSVPVRSAEDLPLRIEIGLVALSGEVTLGDAALPARLWFGGRRGEVSVEMQSDLRGKFAGVLPRDGWWPLEVAADDPPVDLDMRVEVRADANGDAELRVEFPDTELFGRVLYEDGSPAGGARVSLKVEGVGSGQVAGAAGEFTFRGISAGIATLGAHQRAQGERLSSEIALVPVSESIPAGPVELRLRRGRRISGRVVAEGVPVAGAIVELRALEPATAARTDAARTDESGEFSLTVDPNATLLTAIVSPPGMALTSRVVPAGEPILLEVARRGGTLQLVPGQAAPADDGGPPPSLIVVQDGSILGWQELWSWSRGHSVVWVKDSPSILIPELAPGSYRFCRVSAQQAARAVAAMGDWRTALSRCVAGFLEAGATLRLDLSEP